MKILFIAKGDLPDYQSDMVFHGGRSTLGNDFVDCNKLWYMYKDEKELYDNLKDLYYKKQNNIPLLNDVNLTEIKKYSREAQTAKLANIIKNL